MRIREGDPLEIFTDREGEVILKKFSPVRELGVFASEYAGSLNESLGHISCIADRDTFIAVAGAPRKHLLNKQISRNVENVITERKMAVCNGPCYLTSDEDISYQSAIIAPIVTSGDAVGAVILASKNSQVQMGDLETKLAETAAGFLGRQMSEHRM